jgi:hypothetical protein
MNDNPYTFRRILHIAAICALVYLAVAFIAFQARNPKCNRVAAWCHFDSVLHFEKLEQYQ